MVFAYAAAFALLGLSAALLFVWPLVWATPGQRLRVMAGPEMRFLSGCMMVVVAGAVMAPMLADGFADTQSNMLVLAEQARNLSFGM